MDQDNNKKLGEKLQVLKEVTLSSWYKILMWIARIYSFNSKAKQQTTKFCYTQDLFEGGCLADME